MYKKETGIFMRSEYYKVSMLSRLRKINRKVM